MNILFATPFRKLIAYSSLSGLLLTGITACGGGGKSSAADTTAPSLLQVTAVTTPSTTKKPLFTFSSSEAGTITYSGGCTAAITAATAGNNTVTFNTLIPATYNQCTLSVTDAAGNKSTALAVNTFTITASGTISGSVVDNTTGAAIEGARVTVGTSSTLTSAAGTYELANLAVTDHAVVNISKDNFTQGSKITALFADSTSRVDAFLLPVAHSQVLENLLTAQTISVPDSSASVTLPVLGLKTANNGEPSGAITVSITPLDASSNPQIMPGDFSTADNQLIESFGALDVNFKDSTGAPLNLAAGSTSTIHIPVAATSQNDDDLASTLPLWYYDTVLGKWKNEGTLSLKGAAPNFYYEGTVNHFSTWNADALYESACVTGKVTGVSGSPLANARIDAEGLNYTGSSVAYSAADGSFSILVKAQARAVFTARTATGISNSIVAISGAEGSTCTAMQGDLKIGSVSGTAKIKLTWGADPEDLDSHLTGPIPGSSERFHVYYDVDTSVNASLDVDDTSGFGPEIITLSGFNPGIYRYSVHHFGGEGSITESPARVELTISGVTRVFTPPSSPTPLIENTVWTVFELSVDTAGVVTTTPINTYSVNVDEETIAINPNHRRLKPSAQLLSK